MTTRQAISANFPVPVYLNETLTIQTVVPGYGFFNQTIAAAVLKVGFFFRSFP